MAKISFVHHPYIQCWTPEPTCQRCDCGIGEHSCWRAEVQTLPALQAKHPNPVKLKQVVKS